VEKVDFLTVEYIMASRSKSPISYTYPETAIVSITTHGLIKTSDAADGTLIASEFTVPSGMTVIKYSEVSAGVCNFEDSEKITYCVETIKKFKKFIEMTDDINSKKNIVKTVASFFKLRNKRWAKVLQSMKVKKTLDLEQKKFVYYHDRGNTTRMFSSGANMVDKIYSFDELPDKVGHDNKILLLNADGEPDLFARIIQHTPSKDYVSMEEVIAHLHANGVKNVVLFDLSCSEADVSHPSERAERKFNRDLSGKLGGDRKMKRSMRKRSMRKRSMRKRKSMKNGKSKKSRKSIRRRR
jgi:hypothetical protein